MNVHEYQAKELLRGFGVAVPAGGLATTPAEAEEVARSLHADVLVVKSQVHAGGRGKAGGIKLAKSPAEAKRVASEILGMTLRSPQTGPEGKLVRKVWVEAGSEIARELYLAVVVDRERERLGGDRVHRGRHGDRGGGGAQPREDPDASASIPASA